MCVRGRAGEGGVWGWEGRGRGDELGARFVPHVTDRCSAARGTRSTGHWRQGTRQTPSIQPPATHTHTPFSPPPRAAAPLVFPAHPVHGPHCAAPCCAAVDGRTVAVHRTAAAQRSAAQHAAAAPDGPAPGPPHEWRASGRSEACGARDVQMRDGCANCDTVASRVQRAVSARRGPSATPCGRAAAHRTALNASATAGSAEPSPAAPTSLPHTGASARLRRAALRRPRGSRG